MIAKEVFTLDWLNTRAMELKKEYKNIDPILLEKMVKALYLLECLKNEGLIFIFKGGTSLILLLNSASRFSIDIDIIVEKDLDIQKVLDRIIIGNEVFSRYEIDTREHLSLPVAHYKFFYHSLIDQRTNTILLDVLFDENPYMETIECEIKCKLLSTDEPVAKVKTPSIDCILADKLTAFAPNTTGIQYYKNKELEIIKQLYDIACLFDFLNNIQVVKKTFIRIAESEIKYRNLGNTTYIDVLDDIYNTSLILAYRGSRELPIFRHLENGVKKMKSYVLDKKAFIIEDAVGCAAKAAYLSLLLKFNQLDIEKFRADFDLKQYRTQDKLINTILKFNPEGFYYWSKCLELNRAMSEVAAAKEENNG